MARTILNIPSGTTETVAAGETQDTATVTNAGTFENAGTNTAGGLELQTQSVDVDAATPTLTRIRNLTTVGLPTLVVATGETETIASGTTETTGNVENAGTVSNAGTLQTGVEDNVVIDTDKGTSTLTVVVSGVDLVGNATDIDAADVTATRVRDLLATGSDPDVATTPLTRLRELIATADNIDTSTATTTRVRDLFGESIDSDVATLNLQRIRELQAQASDVDDATSSLFILIDPQSERAVGTIREILGGASDSRWTVEPPTILNYWDRTQQERGPGADQPAEIYVWETAGKDIERFSLDNTTTHDTASVEALVYSLDEQEVIDYAEDARNILERYFDVNKSPTEWQTIEVTSVNDFREQTQRRSTDQYVVSLEIELEKIDSV